MRREQQVRYAGEDRALRRIERFLREHVERRAAQVAAEQAGRERGFVDDAAARGVQQDRAAPHRAEPGGVEHSAGLRGQWHVQADDIAALHEFIERDTLGDFPGRMVRRQERVGGTDA